MYACYLYENSQGTPPDTQENNSSPKFLQPTYEQNAIIKHDLKPREIIKIVAFAGTGKTTTLVKLTERHPRMKFLNLCYNKSIQLQADKLFPRNVENRTWHSMAFREIGTRYKDSRKLTGSLRVQNITRCLKKGTTFLRAQRVLKCLSSYISSSRPSITIIDVVDSSLSDDPKINEKYNSNDYKEDIVRDAKICWSKMIDVWDKNLYMTHDGYLKLYQLSEPCLDQYDCILIDEAQDCTPANASILLNQECAKILVGDPYQQIYSFRGAKNVMDEIQCTSRSTLFYLTQSFRFGPEIGYIANSLLESLKDVQHKTLMGNSSSGTVMGQRSGQLAIICRTNFCLFGEAVRVCQSGQNNRIAFAGGIDGYGFDRVLTIYSLRYGGYVNDPFLKMFSYTQLVKYAREASDKELMGKIKIVEVYKYHVPAHIEAIKKLAVENMENADIVFSTVHKAKGLEFDTVRLADDFTVDKHINGIPVENSEDEKNMLYVAVTRAKKSLQMNSTVKNVLLLNQEHFLQPTVPTKQVAKTTNPECIYCYNRLVLDPLPHMIMMRPKLTVFRGGVRDECSGGLLCITCAMERAPHFGCFVNPALPAKRKKGESQKEHREQEEQSEEESEQDEQSEREEREEQSEREEQDEQSEREEREEQSEREEREEQSEQESEEE